MKDKILKEITEHCKDCLVKEKCPENECVLFRIEQLVLKKQKKEGINERLDRK